MGPKFLEVYKLGSRAWLAKALSALESTHISDRIELIEWLFEKQQFEEFNPCPKNMGDNFFENCTRQQLKEIK